MTSQRKNIYATNNSLAIYTFRIFEETETHYKAYDIAIPSWYFNFEKDTLKCTCEHKSIENIINDDLFVSFDLDEVKKEYTKRCNDFSKKYYLF